MAMLSVRTTDSNESYVTITPTRPIPVGDVSAKAYDNAEVPNDSQPKATDTTPPTTPTLDTDLGGKAGTQTPITVTTDPNTHVDLLVKTVYYWFGYDGRNGHVTHRRNLFLKVMSLPKRRIVQNIRIVLHLNRKKRTTYR